MDGLELMDVDFTDRIGINPPKISNDEARTIVQILIKTLIVHIFCIANFGHLQTVLRVPTQHNNRLIRLIIFAFFPAVTASALLVDAIWTLSRFLQNPDETSWPALNFYLHGTLGVRAWKRSDDDDPADRRVESTRLSQLGDIDAAHQEKVAWTWQRFSRIGFASIAMLQGAGTITLWARRIIEDATMSIDSRNFYMACGSIIASIQVLLLLPMGNRWSYSPESHGHLSLPKWPETRRLLIEVILAGVIQEAASHFATNENLPRYATSIWAVAPNSALEWILYGVLVLGLILFRRDIETKMGMKLQPISILLLAVVGGWIVVDAIGLVVVDIIGLVQFDPLVNQRWYGGSEAWRDPWQPIVPVI